MGRLWRGGINRPRFKMAQPTLFGKVVAASQLNNTLKAALADIKQPTAMVSLYTNLHLLPRDAADQILHDVHDISALSDAQAVHVPLCKDTLAKAVLPNVFIRNTKHAFRYTVKPAVPTATPVDVCLESYVDCNLIINLSQYITMLYPDLLRINTWADQSPLMQ